MLESINFSVGDRFRNTPYKSIQFYCLKNLQTWMNISCLHKKNVCKNQNNSECILMHLGPNCTTINLMFYDEQNLQNIIYIHTMTKILNLYLQQREYTLHMPLHIRIIKIIIYLCENTSFIAMNFLFTLISTKKI